MKLAKKIINKVVIDLSNSSQLQRHKMKKTIYSLAFLGIALGSSCVADAASSSQSPVSSLFSKTRVGFGLAGEYINAGANLKVDPRGRLPQGITSSQSHLEKSFQIAPCIELGSILASHYYLGLQVSWRSSNITNKSKTPTTLLVYFLHEFKINYYTDVLLKAGYKLTPCTMIYGLIGPTFAKWSHTTDFYDGNNALFNRSIKIDKKSLGLGVGFGFEYFFKEKYAFSFDYTHHFHKSVSQDQNMTILTLGGARSGNLNKKVHPSYGVLAARFTVFFNL